jgi:hypothetical protein
MNISEFDNAIDAIEIDPRKRLKDSAKHIVSSAIGADVPSDLADRLIQPRLRQLFDRAAACIKAGDFAGIDGHLTGFRLDLTDAVGRERRDGALRRPAPADEIKKFGGAWSDHRWNGFETAALLQMLEQDERILHVGLREIKTDRRTIARSEMKAFAQSRLRPKWAHDDEYFARNFTAEFAIKEAEERAAREIERRDTYSSGPREIIGKRIGSVT